MALKENFMYLFPKVNQKGDIGINYCRINCIVEACLLHFYWNYSNIGSASIKTELWLLKKILCICVKKLIEKEGTWHMLVTENFYF